MIDKSSIKEGKFGNVSILKKEPLRVTSIDELDKINDIIHDEYFDLCSVKFDKEKKTEEIAYRRIFHDGPMRVVRNWLLFRTFEVDVIRSILTIHNVEDYTYKDSAMIATFTFNKISYKDNALLIECCQSLELRMAISDIEIESCDVEIKGKSRISCFLLVEISTGKVYK